MDKDTLTHLTHYLASLIDEAMPLEGAGYALVVMSASSWVTTGSMHGVSLKKPALNTIFRATISGLDINEQLLVDTATAQKLEN